MSPPIPINTSLWDFSLHYYARPGVSSRCLHLQDEYGINVNILLWTLWLGYRGIQLEPALLAQVLGNIRSWDQNYILPLRQLRRQMKAEFGIADAAIETVRTQIKQAELQAEKHLQHQLELYLPEHGASAYAATTAHKIMADNIQLYLRPCGINETLIADLLAEFR